LTPEGDLSEATRRRNLWILVGAAAVFHLVVAVSFELTSDEANGWMYARFPAASYFDHPPLWGVLIWLSTFGGSLASALAIRLPAIALSAATTLLIHRWVRETLGPRAAWHSALLFNLSFLFTGVGAIHLPDSGLFFFWLLTLYCLTRALQSGETGTRERAWMLLAGLPLGFAMLSKYHGLLLAPCVFAFLATDPVRRRWLARPEPWISFGLACVLFLPVIAWNAENDWVSFRFQGGRLANSDADPGPVRLLVNLAAPALYLNPYVFVLTVAGAVAAFRRRPGFDRFPIRLLLFASLPVIAFFAVGSILNESSLPHWPGVGYLGLVPLAGAFLESRVGNRFLPLGARASIAAVALLVGFAAVQIHFGPFDPDRGRRDAPAFVEHGRRDATTEMIGWGGLDRRLAEIVGAERDALLFADRWHTAARLDFYAAAPLGLRVACLSELGQERALAFMRPEGLVAGASGWFVVPSNRFKGETPFADRFDRVDEPVALDVERGGRVAKRFYVYRCHRLRETPPPPLGARDPLRSLEAGLFFAVNSGLKSRVADWVIGYSNWLGSGYVGIPIVLLIALWVWRRDPARRRRDIAAGALAAAAVIANVLGVKELCDRPRPLKAFEAAIARGEAQVHAMFSPGSQRGFPSGHTATAFALAAVVSMLLRRRSAVAIAFAVAAVVGVSTLYVGAHRPLDVVGGAMVGSIWTFWAFGVASCCYGSEARSVP
jgi:membrane-associated phospholipid phosphatase